MLDTGGVALAQASGAREVVAEDLAYIGGALAADFEQMAGSRLLITGGAGFLGHYLVQAVLVWNRGAGRDRPIAVTVYDNYVRGVPAWLTALQGDRSLTVVQHDMTLPLPSDLGDFEYIIHAASIASPTYYRKYPIETMDANVNGLRALLEYARRQRESNRPVRGFLFFSSSEIYGDPPPAHIPTPETYRGYVSCTGPRACYDEAKRYGETLCVNFAQAVGIPVKVARPFNNYGPGLKITDRRALPDFARDIFANRDIVLFSDGSPRRTFCYVADAVIGYYRTLVRGRSGEAYNIGVEAPEVSIAELAGQVVALARELVGYSGRVVHRVPEDGNYLLDNPGRRCPLILKARTELAYNPTVSLPEGLRRSLLWYRDNRAAVEA